MSIFSGTLRRRSREGDLVKIKMGYHLTTKNRGGYSGRRRGGEMFSRQCVEVLLRKGINKILRYICAELEQKVVRKKVCI